MSVVDALREVFQGVCKAALALTRLDRSVRQAIKLPWRPLAGQVQLEQLFDLQARRAQVVAELTEQPLILVILSGQKSIDGEIGIDNAKVAHGAFQSGRIIQMPICCDAVSGRNARRPRQLCHNRNRVCVLSEDIIRDSLQFTAIGGKEGIQLFCP
jgi:hypothetical protein